MPKAALAIVAVAALSLGFAFLMQYHFGYEPCVLCLWQRLPYAVAGLLALAAFVIKPYGRTARMLLTLCGVAFLIGAVLAGFHSGVERHWWAGTSGCAIQPLHGTSVSGWREQLLHMTVARCDEISWTFLGLSMANWNVPLSLALAAFAKLAAQRIKK